MRHLPEMRKGCMEEERLDQHDVKRRERRGSSVVSNYRGTRNAFTGWQMDLGLCVCNSYHFINKEITNKARWWEGREQCGSSVFREENGTCNIFNAQCMYDIAQ